LTYSVICTAHGIDFRGLPVSVTTRENSSILVPLSRDEPTMHPRDVSDCRTHVPPAVT
jgi:hypothetical protein